jgi:hypothetical protein
MSHRDDEDAEKWKLLGFGRSSKFFNVRDAHFLKDPPVYVAPEVAVGTGVGPGADQFALAATVFHCAFGRPPWIDRSWDSARPEKWTIPQAPFGSDLGAAARDVYEVLSRGLAAVPEKRFPSIEHLLTALQKASRVSRRPSISPIDATELDTVSGGHPGAVSVSVEPSAANIDQERPGSVEVSVEDLVGRAKVRMSFRSARRLRREWRRNIVGGGVFVPTSLVLDEGKPVVVTIEFLPSSRSTRFNGSVMGHEVEPVRGLAVEIEPADRDGIHEFISQLQLGAFDARAVIQRSEKNPAPGEVGGDEKFVLSKVSQPRSMGALRQAFSNLPFALDDVVARLEEAGWVRVLGATNRASPSGEHLVMPPSDEDLVESVVRRAAFLRSQGNFLAEIETLEIAADRYQSAVLLHRLAFSRLQFRRDFESAVRDLERAVVFDPSNRECATALESLRWVMVKNRPGAD